MDHQQQQESIAAKVASGLWLLWPVLGFSRLKETTPAWLHASMLQVQSGWDSSAVEAAEFVQHSRWAMEPGAPPLDLIRIEFPAAATAKSLEATGPGRVRQLMPGDESEIMTKAQKASSGVGQALALNGGREQVQAQVLKMAPERKSNDLAIGWARFTENGNGKNSPCYFCAMLASRGAFYLTEDSFKKSDSQIRDIKRNGKVVERRAFVGNGQAKVHDHCRCSLRPVFSLKDSRDERANYFLDQWKTYGKGGKGEDGKYHTAMQNFRNNYIPPAPYRPGDVLSLEERRSAIATARQNRDVLLFNRGLGENSPQVAFWEGVSQRLEAI